jgi:hypothetical protein
MDAFHNQSTALQELTCPKNCNVSRRKWYLPIEASYAAFFEEVFQVHPASTHQVL